MSQKEDAEMLANLDLLLNMDIVESENDWNLFSVGSTSSKEAMPDDLPDDESEIGGGEK